MSILKTLKKSPSCVRGHSCSMGLGQGKGTDVDWDWEDLVPPWLSQNFTAC